MNTPVSFEVAGKGGLGLGGVVGRWLQGGVRQRLATFSAGEGRVRSQDLRGVVGRRLGCGETATGRAERADTSEREECW